MKTRPIVASRGLIRGAMLLVLLALVAVGSGWWWFLGRFRVPDKEPTEATSVAPVLDYAGRRELGTDPLGDMEKPSLGLAVSGGVEEKLYLTNWTAAYMKATAARVKWKAAEAASLVSDALPRERYQLEYLHEAQRAEYWRARYVNASQD